jgi:hypothetical protein
MKKILLLVGLALIGVAAWYFFETRPKPDHELGKPKPIKASQHSPAFNGSVDSMLQAYFALSDALVRWDSAAVQQQTAPLQSRLAGIRLDELQNDSLIYQTAVPYFQNTQQQATEMANAKGLEQKRRAFHSLSQNLYDLLRTVRYDASTVYFQECPMAFNDDETGHWLSNTAAIRNPYLGLHHPKYKSGMLECGETKDSLDYAHVQ